MFRNSAIFRKVSPFALFLKETKRHPKIRGLNGPSRAVAVTKLYRALSAQKVTNLAQRALKVSFPRKVKIVKKKQNRKLSVYNKFVKVQSQKLASLPITPTQRLRKIAKLWKAAKKN